MHAKVLVNSLIPGAITSSEIAAIKNFVEMNNLETSNLPYSHFSGKKIYAVNRYNGQPLLPPRGTQILNIGTIGIIDGRMLQWVILRVD